jgi:GNAT superfamily N-acetyltransferase
MGEAGFIGSRSSAVPKTGRDGDGAVLRVVEGAEKAQAIARLRHEWGEPVIVHDRAYRFDNCTIFVIDDFVAIAAISEAAAPTVEIVALNAFQRWRGLGSALIEGIAGFALSAGHVSLRVTTTNDNVDALRFYQRRGFRLAALRLGAVDEARQAKPSIPVAGDYGIPMRDELDLLRLLR